jgi:hypothetical protein
MKQVFILFVLVLSFSSCKENSNNKDVAQETLKDTTRYGTEKFIFPSLNPNAESLVKDWPIFRDFQHVAVRLQNLPIEDYKRYSTDLLTHTDSLSKNIPDTLFSPAIQSRLVVVKTRLSLLHQETKKGTPNPENIEQYIKETRIAIENFIVQINEKAEKDLIDIQRRKDEETELEKQQKDSLSN